MEPFDHHFSNMEQDQQKRAERSREVAEEPTTLGLWRKSHEGKDYLEGFKYFRFWENSVVTFAQTSPPPR